MKTVTTSVGFQDPLGNLVLSGNLVLTLSQAAEVTSGGGLIAPKVVVLPLNATTAKIASTQIWFNDELTPTGTTYHSELLDSGGNIIADFGQWSITGASADLSTMVPVQSGTVSVAGVVLTSPAVTQTVAQPSGTSLNVNIFEKIRFADQFGSTSAAFTDAATTGAVAFPPNYTPTGFTNSNNRPVIDLTRVDWPGSVNVRAFGAKGDGSTDDTTAIQAAINFACTGSSTTVPTANSCPNAISGTAVGGTVYLPAGDYHTSAPLLLYGGVRLMGAGKLASKITKTTNTVGSGSITAGTGVGRSPTACGGGTCVDSFAVDSIISVPYISSGNTDYAYRWSIRDLALYGSGTNGTKYGIYAPRAAQAEMKNLYIFMNCSQGAPANCGSVQGHGFWTEDSWLMRHEGNTVDSSWVGWTHANDNSNLGAGTSSIFSNDWAVNVGCAGFRLYGLSYSNMAANAVDHFNKKGTDLAASDVSCAPYSFSSANGMSINGGGAEDVIGGIMYAAASSVAISGGFKTFTQVGQTSAGTLATLYMDSAASVTMNGTLFSAVTSPGNIFNIVLQGGSTLIDTNSTLPSGGNGFIGYGGGSMKIDVGNSGQTLTTAAGSRSLGVLTDTLFAAPPALGNTTPAAVNATTLTTTGLVTKYNNISTTGNGLASEVATVDLTAQTAAINTTTLYAVPASGAGQYRLSWDSKVTTAAGVSSTLGPMTITYTDPDGVAITQVVAGMINGGTVQNTGPTNNNTSTLLIGVPLTLNCKASTNITYSFAYASNAANAMAYNLHIKLEAL